MSVLMKLQQTTTGNLTGADETPFSAGVKVGGAIPEEWRYTSQPSIAYCWYWGCNSVCHEQRFLINRWWLFSSVILCFLDIVNVIVASQILVKIPSKNKSVSVDEEEEEDIELMAPLRGRRKRQLVQNPSGLMF